jgi:hypothetical protein
MKEPMIDADSFLRRRRTALAALLVLISGCVMQSERKGGLEAIVTFDDDTPRKGDAVLCDGSSSTGNDPGAMRFNWTVRLTSEDSVVVRADSGVKSILFVPDKAGLYFIELTIDDGEFSESAGRYLYVRPEGVPIGPNASQVIFTENGSDYNVGFVPNDYFYYDVLQSDERSERRITVMITKDLGNNSFLTWFFVYDETEPDPPPPQNDRIYRSVAATKDLPRTLDLTQIGSGKIAKSDYPRVESVWFFVDYRDAHGQKHSEISSDNGNRKFPFVIDRTFQ